MTAASPRERAATAPERRSRGPLRRAHRHGTRLTGAGRAVAVSAVVLGGAAMALRSPALAVIASGAMWTVVWSRAQARWRPAPTVRVEVDPPLVVRGGAARVVVEARARRRSGPWTVVVDVDGHPTPVLLPSAGPRTSRVTVAVPTAVRRRIVVGPVRLEAVGGFGLAVRVLHRPAAAVGWVHPRVPDVVSPPSTVGGAPVLLPAPDGDLDQVRPYVPGDDPRHVHWPTSARAGALVVRAPVAAEHPPVEVVVDDVGWTGEPLEHLCERAAATVLSWWASGAVVRLSTTSGRRTTVAGPDGRAAALRCLAELDGAALPGDRQGAVPPAVGVRVVLAPETR